MKTTGQTTKCFPRVSGMLAALATAISFGTVSPVMAALIEPNSSAIAPAAAGESGVPASTILRPGGGYSTLRPEVLTSPGVAGSQNDILSQTTMGGRLVGGESGGTGIFQADGVTAPEPAPWLAAGLVLILMGGSMAGQMVRGGAARAIAARRSDCSRR